jgi:hypothetical protein
LRVLSSSMEEWRKLVDWGGATQDAAQMRGSRWRSRCFATWRGKAHMRRVQEVAVYRCAHAIFSATVLHCHLVTLPLSQSLSHPPLLSFFPCLSCTPFFSPCGKSPHFSAIKSRKRGTSSQTLTALDSIFRAGVRRRRRTLHACMAAWRPLLHVGESTDTRLLALSEGMEERALNRSLRAAFEAWDISSRQPCPHLSHQLHCTRLAQRRDRFE